LGLQGLQTPIYSPYSGGLQTPIYSPYSGVGFADTHPLTLLQVCGHLTHVTR
jgi:hypothetical protein